MSFFNLFTFWLVLAFSLCLVTSKSVFLEHDLIENISKRQNGSQFGTAIDGSLPVRRNINDLQNDRVSWSLYIQALTNLQKKSNGDTYSYFQLSGIHGRPYAQWNDSPKNPDSHNTGYCTHNSVLFLPWHRPYILTFEQAIIAEAQSAAKLYVNRPEYTEAANNLRLPYWDWAAVPKLPDVVSQAQVEIETPTGTQLVENPLNQFKFPDTLDPNLFPSTSSDGWLSQYINTVRGVDSKSPTQMSNPDAINRSLQSSKLTANTWRSLVKAKDFNAFGSTATPGTSIENIHNSLHSYVGSRYGHMSYLSYAAYDPIFWLHHVNVDRLFALWQVLNPNSYVEAQEDEYGNFVIPPNSMVDANTALQPFRNKASGQWWTPESARDIRSFSYSYPELQGNQTPEQLKANVTASINRLYNPNNAFSRRFAKRGQRGFIPRSLSTREWSIGMSVSKFDVGGERFKILFFVNGVPSSPDDWESSPTLAGSTVIFPPPHSSKLKLPLKLTTYSEIDLGNSLEDNGLDPRDVPGVVEFLRTKLEWRIQRLDGTVVPLEQVPSLLVNIQDEVVTLPSDITKLPTFGEKTIHPEVLRLRK